MLIALSWVANAQSVTEAPNDLNVQHLRPTLDGRHTLWTDDSRRAAHLRPFGRTLLHYTHKPLMYRGGDGAERSLVANVAQLDLMGGVGFGRFRIGANLPIYLFANGESVDGTTGLGDFAVDGKLSILEEDAALGLALQSRLSFPTATLDSPLGARNTGWEVSVIVDKTVGDLWLGGNVGVRGGPDTELAKARLNDFLILRLAAGYALTEKTGGAIELAGDIPFTEHDGVGLPLEVLLGGYGSVSKNVVVRAGIGRGLNNSIASPDVRLLLGLGYEPSSKHVLSDMDGDGIGDDVDACISQPEDRDGEMDSDGCPDDIGRVRLRVVDGNGARVDDARVVVEGRSGKLLSSDLEVQLEAGSHVVQVEADGFGAASRTLELVDGDDGRVVEIVLQPVAERGTVALRIEGEDGVLIPGSRLVVAGESYAGPKREQSLPAGSYTVDVIAPGFRSQKGVDLTVANGAVTDATYVMKRAKAELSGDHIDIRDSVYFETSRDVIQQRSYGLLDEVVDLLAEHDELVKIRIEGHTDSRGAAAYNKQLSQRRADAVKRYLVQHGIAAERLESVGYGEEKPIDPARNEAAYTKNRRVDFFVEERK